MPEKRRARAKMVPADEEMDVTKSSYMPKRSAFSASAEREEAEIIRMEELMKMATRKRVMHCNCSRVSKLNGF
jgi:hypothetical protein